MPQTAQLRSESAGKDRQDGCGVPAAEQERDRDSAVTRAHVTEPQPDRRFWFAVLIAAIASLPFCWLLSFAALLPFYIGLFFFALFGLVIGAVVFRFAAPGKPYRGSTVVMGTTALVLGAWGGSIWIESRDLPRDMADKAIRRTPDLRGSTSEEFRGRVAEDVRKFMAERYPPGGVLGYVRWAASNGKFKKGDLASAQVSLALNQTRYLFLIRVALSIGLLAFGIASQTWPLKHIPAARRESEP